MEWFIDLPVLKKPVLKLFKINPGKYDDDEKKEAVLNENNQLIEIAKVALLDFSNQGFPILNKV